LVSTPRVRLPSGSASRAMLRMTWRQQQHQQQG
jgi:hypothetical protein